MSVYKPLFFNNSSGLSLIFWEPSVFLPPLSPNNLIFNNIDFRYRFAFSRYLHFFSITFPGSWFVVLERLWASSGLCRGGNRSLTVAGVNMSRTVPVSKRSLTPTPLPLFPLPREREEGRRGEMVRGFFLAVRPL